MSDSASLAYLTEKGLQLDLGPRALSKLLARYEIFKMIEELPGDIVECGVYRGAALFQWANFIELFAPHSRKTVIGFDTFDGFPAIHTYPPDRESVGRLASEKAKFIPRTMQEITAIAEKLGLSHRFRLIEGDAMATIPDFVGANPGLRISMLHLDFDVYDPTLMSLRCFFPLIVPGGIVVLDQYGKTGWGESNAVDEFFAGQEVRFERFRWSASPAAYFVKSRVGSL